MTHVSWNTDVVYIQHLSVSPVTYGAKQVNSRCPDEPFSSVSDLSLQLHSIYKSCQTTPPICTFKYFDLARGFCGRVLKKTRFETT